MADQSPLAGMGEDDVERLQLTPKVDGFAVTEGSLTLSGGIGLYAYEPLDRELVERLLEPEDPLIAELAHRWGEGSKPARSFTLLVKAKFPQVSYPRVYDKAGRDVGRELKVKLTTVQLLDDKGLGALVDEKERRLEAFGEELRTMRSDLVNLSENPRLTPTWALLLEKVGYLWDIVNGISRPATSPQEVDPETGEILERESSPAAAVEMTSEMTAAKTRRGRRSLREVVGETGDLSDGE